MDVGFGKIVFKGYMFLFVLNDIIMFDYEKCVVDGIEVEFLMVLNIEVLLEYMMYFL